MPIVLSLDSTQMLLEKCESVLDQVSLRVVEAQFHSQDQWVLVHSRPAVLDGVGLLAGCLGMTDV